MLMGHSIEGRFPFLDYRVAELAARLPDRLRLRGLEEKHVLRRAMAPLLPPEVYSRTKRPYRAPIGQAFVGPDAPEYVRDLLSPARLAEAGVLDPEAVRRVVAKLEAQGAARAGETDEMALVGAVSTMLLHEQLVARPSLAPEAVPTRVVVGDRVERVDGLAAAGAAS
jgi:asparagine synthase (glutamine-hydrolysing)